MLGSNALSANFLRPLRGYGQISLYESAATSNYNALQISLNKRATTGLFFGLSYTWSKALTTATTDSTWVRADGFTRAADYGPANFDRRQIFALNYVYNLPRLARGNFLTHVVTNGWQISGVTTAGTGSPFTPGVSISMRAARISPATPSPMELRKAAVSPWCPAAIPIPALATSGIDSIPRASPRRSRAAWPGIGHQFPIRARLHQLRYVARKSNLRCANA